MSPFPSLGQISFTKFTSPEGVTDVLAGVEPGVTTAAEVERSLRDAKLAEPLWNDLLAYDPAILKDNERPGVQVAVDNELLRASREGRDDRFLLMWAALNLADPRLDGIMREVLTDAAGHLVPEMVNPTRLGAELDARHSADPREPADGKVVSNLLSLLERSRLIVPTKRGKTITGVERQLPTGYAVPGVVRLVTERLADRGFTALPGRELEMALAMGANAWLNLSPSEFRDAYEGRAAAAARPQTPRQPLPDDLMELASQLRRGGQVVLQGAPGAGKTYVARRYVGWATGGRTEDSRLRSIVDALPEHQRTVEAIANEVVARGLSAVWDIVQFHPGYDYTDFVRALVARPHGSGVTFVAEHRILSLICAVGRELADRGYEVEMVLVLDEINRGDIPNIFGELLYALEYRDQAVATPYVVDGEGSLTIPNNLKVLGTMNTADRSIAVIDYALRRRFVFLDVATSDAPIRGFTGFDDESVREAALYLYEQTREALVAAPAGLQVGPSYFLAEADGDIGSMTVLADRFVYEVLPLLTEYALEGEVDAATVSSLEQGLGLGDGTTQREQARDLATHLGRSPWQVTAPAAASISSPDDESVDGQQEG